MAEILFDCMGMPVIRSRGGKLESLEVSSDPLIFVIAFSTNNTNLTEKR